MDNMPRGMSVDKSAKALDTLERARACGALNNQELTARLAAAAIIEQKALAVLLAYLAEFGRRKLYADLGYSSLFAYVTRALGYSEDAAAKRIHAARATNRFPALLQLLDAREVHLTAVVLLAPHLTAENHQELLDQARGKTSRELEFIVARLAPREVETDCVRRLPAPAGAQPMTDICQAASPTQVSTDPPPSSQASFPRIEPLSPERIRFSFTGSLETLRNVDRAKELLWHKHPHGRLEEIIDELLEFFLKRKDPERRIQAKMDRL